MSEQSVMSTESLEMDGVIDRLRASQVECGGDLYDAGYEAGVHWAKEFASAIELRRLWREWEAALPPSGRGDWLYFGDDSSSPGDNLVEIVRPFEVKHTNTEFWEEAIGDEDVAKADEPEYVHGFAAGAVDVWNQVRDKL